MGYSGENAIEYHSDPKEFTWIPDIGYVRTSAGYVIVNSIEPKDETDVGRINP